jgi:NADH-quinone oxidoreductase subunit H
MILFLAKYTCFIVGLLLGVAFLTLVERTTLGAIQLRTGPNVVGFAGLLQPFADAAKLLLKETIIPSPANRWLFIFAPLLTFSCSLLFWIIIPYSHTETLLDFNLGVFYVLAVSSLGVYGILIARLV